MVLRSQKEQYIPNELIRDDGKGGPAYFSGGMSVDYAVAFDVWCFGSLTQRTVVCKIAAQVVLLVVRRGGRRGVHGRFGAMHSWGSRQGPATGGGGHDNSPSRPSGSRIEAGLGETAYARRAGADRRNGVA